MVSSFSKQLPQLPGVRPLCPRSFSQVALFHLRELGVAYAGSSSDLLTILGWRCGRCRCAAGKGCDVVQSSTYFDRCRCRRLLYLRSWEACMRVLTESRPVSLSASFVFAKLRSLHTCLYRVETSVVVGIFWICKAEKLACESCVLSGGLFSCTLFFSTMRTAAQGTQGRPSFSSFSYTSYAWYISGIYLCASIPSLVCLRC